MSRLVSLTFTALTRPGGGLVAKARAVRRNITPTPEDEARAERSGHIPGLTNEERLTPLSNYTPKNRKVTDDVREQAIALILQTPHSTTARDLDVMAALTQVIEYDVTIHGYFDPGRAMSESGLRRWVKESLAQRGISEGSRGDYLSLIRYVAKHTGFAPHLSDRVQAPRGIRQAPADAKSWSRVRERATRLPKDLCTDVTMVADLTYGVGMRGDEVGRATIDDLILRANGMALLRIGNRSSVIREVPAGPYLTQRILQAGRKTGEFLVRPQHSRHNLTHHLFKAAEKHVKGVKFDLIAARNRYIVDLLGKPIPFRAVCELADLGPGGHTAQDLARFAHLPTRAAIEEMVRGTWT